MYGEMLRDAEMKKKNKIKKMKMKMKMKMKNRMNNAMKMMNAFRGFGGKKFV